MNTLKDLNKHLFDQMDRLAKSSGDNVSLEIDRSKSMVEISSEIVKAHQLQLDAASLVAKYKGGLSEDQRLPVISIETISIGN
mgnify:CR=1 FL=1